MDTNTLKKYADKIKSEEGYSSTVYKCPAGYWTIGFGRLVDPAKTKEGITKEEAEHMLTNDIITREQSVRGFIPSFEYLSDNRKIALIDMSYQIGITGLQAFRRMLQAIDRKDYKMAAEELLNSEYAKQTPERARRNYNLIREG